ncbi:Glyoxalase-like domain-containing protein [Oscillibacter sp. PC13]|uniref:VOC family protein n=1 Tax=Oscillibacter sp. PC13 TaxID=1855299 RepID=UPI0008E4392F|nr:VOC family protein [Oscillibacter sp. PC13]SFP72648.1 Glyoxalase-like domain-containing protein [Oscillibacter sp. PC13]
MKLENTLLAVRDLQGSLEFYRNILGLEAINVYGASAVLSGGLSLQTLEAWAECLEKRPEEIAFDGNADELCFVAEDFDAFLKILKSHPEVELVRPPMEHRWGQQVVRLYDPDRHIVEVGEPLPAVAKRFRDAGLTEEGVAKRMEVPLESVRRWLK